MTPDTAFFRFLQHVKAIFEAKEGGDPWYYGLGYDSWRSGGRVVARHGLQGA
jgi:hypothetical protein